MNDGISCLGHGGGWSWLVFGTWWRVELRVELVGV